MGKNKRRNNSRPHIYGDPLGYHVKISDFEGNRLAFTLYNGKLVALVKQLYAHNFKVIQWNGLV